MESYAYFEEVYLEELIDIRHRRGEDAAWHEQLAALRPEGVTAAAWSALLASWTDEQLRAAYELLLTHPYGNHPLHALFLQTLQDNVADIPEFFQKRLPDVWRYPMWREVMITDLADLIRSLTNPPPAAADWTAVLAPWSDEQLKAARALLVDFPVTHELRREFYGALVAGPAAWQHGFFDDLLARYYREQAQRQGNWCAIHAAAFAKAQERIPDLLNENELIQWYRLVQPDIAAADALGLRRILHAEDLALVRKRLEFDSDLELKAFAVKLLELLQFDTYEERRRWLDLRRLTVEQLRKWPLQKDVIGVALSGGGIRSATFGLGAIQALAELGILPALDYQSSVSGGGYIGGWLAAWILREQDNAKVAQAVQNVARQLAPGRKENASAVRGASTDPVPPNNVVDVEPEPLHHLRAYSNYLSPKLGIFSTDGWSLIATYLRNLILNQLLVLLAMLAVLFFVSLIIQTFATAYTFTCSHPATEHPWVYAFYAVPSALLLLLLAWASVHIFFSLEVIPLGPPGNTQDNQAARAGRAAFAKDFHVHRRILAPLLVSAALLTLLAICYGLPLAETLGHIPLDPVEWLAAINDSWARDPVYAWCWQFTFWMLLAGLSLWLRGKAWRFLTPPHYRAANPTFVNRCLGDVVAAIYLPCLMLSLGALIFCWNNHYPWLGVGVFLAMVHSSFNARSWLYFEGAPNYSLIGIASGLIPGFLGGILICVVMRWFGAYVRITDLPTQPYHFPVVITVGPPLLLLLFVLMETLQIGIQGKLMSDQRREWWASLNGLVLLYASGWLVTFALTIFGTALVYMAQGEQWRTSTASIGVILGWAATVYAGLRFSYGSQTDGVRRPSSYLTLARESLARVAPLIFLLGYYLMLCIAANWLIYWESFDSDLAFLKVLSLPLSASYLQTCPVISAIPGPYAEFRPFWALLVSLFLAAIFAWLLGRRVDVNLFSLQGLYAQRLVRAYLGASRSKMSKLDAAPHSVPCASEPPERVSHPLTGFDPDDDLDLHRFCPRAQPAAAEQKGFAGPCLVINTTLNLTAGPELAWQERKAESFVLTPRFCGSTSTGYRPTHDYAARLKKLTLGAAVGVSGAAVSPNMGYHSSPAVAAFLTVFNARLGAWVGNPRSDVTWHLSGPRNGLLYLFKEALNRTDARDEYIYLSDGGHFDNLGVYELIRRRCRFIICTDASADPDYSFFDLAMMIRKVRIDFGVRIHLDLSALRPQGNERRAKRHVAIGKIYYKDVDGPADEATFDHRLDLVSEDKERYRYVGVLIYVKPSLTGGETPDVANYAADNPAFPHESTVDQFFTESQFESYRALGYHCMHGVFRQRLPAASSRADRLKLFQGAFDYWCSLPGDLIGPFANANEVYMSIQDELGKNPHLNHFQAELALVSRVLSRTMTPADFAHFPGHTAQPAADGLSAFLAALTPRRHGPRQIQAERAMVARMLTFMESTYYDLKLEDLLNHPVNDGWRAAFCRWVSMPTFQLHAKELKAEFSGPFNRFWMGLCGLPT